MPNHVTNGLEIYDENPDKIHTRKVATVKRHTDNQIFIYENKNIGWSWFSLAMTVRLVGKNIEVKK